MIKNHPLNIFSIKVVVSKERHWALLLVGREEFSITSLVYLIYITYLGGGLVKGGGN
jgi:hypothetical protein